MIIAWGRELLLSGNAWERLFIFVVDAVEEERIMLGRRDARLVDTANLLGLGGILGRRRRLPDRGLSSSRGGRALEKAFK